MITDGILYVVFKFVLGMLSRIPAIELVVDEGAFNLLGDYFRVACYLLPMDAVTSILSIVIAITGFRIAVSIIKTIWALLPVV